ncbi:MAG: hypothetical protein GY925_17845, partial [Actinomycetia bacterium]|nr:hypothetical protein [Actinomycetes bacterium]
FGNVGGHFSELAAEAGCQVVAVADHTGTIRADGGLDIDKLRAWVRDTGGVADFPAAERVDTEDLFREEVDVFVPAALENQLTAPRANALTARLVIEAANGPTTTEAEVILTDRGVEIVPDILANAGGVIVSYFEWLQNKSSRAWPVEDVDERFRTLVWKAHDEVVEKRNEFNCSRRDAAYIVALARLDEVYSRRGIFP